MGGERRGVLGTTKEVLGATKLPRITNSLGFLTRIVNYQDSAIIYDLDLDLDSTLILILIWI